MFEFFNSEKFPFFYVLANNVAYSRIRPTKIYFLWCFLKLKKKFFSLLPKKNLIKNWGPIIHLGKISYYLLSGLGFIVIITLN
ncbi:MAG: hypothetical protein CM15mP129_09750 [Chloroflexota bacterium]|nr:MAG: hypothetical protein CM15mP129_09750 [Chloroflexota bacterium]